MLAPIDAKFTDAELELIEELVTHFLEHKAESSVEIRLADSILQKIDGQLNGED